MGYACPKWPLLQIPGLFFLHGTLWCTKKATLGERHVAGGRNLAECRSFSATVASKTGKFEPIFCSRILGRTKSGPWSWYFCVEPKVSRCRNCVIPLFDIHPQKVFGRQGGCVFEDVDVMNMCFSKNPQQISRRRHSRRLI